MGEDILFVQSDPRGYEISLTSEQYFGHIIQESGHTEVPIQDIQEAVKNPIAIYQSGYKPSRDVYFAKTSSVYPKLYVRVTAEINESDKTGDIVTTFLNRKIEQGIDEERGPKYIDYNNKL